MRRAAATIVAIALAGCQVTETSRTLQPTTTAPVAAGPSYDVVIGQLQNRSPYMNGLFSDGTDRLGSQARNILATHLAQSERFNLLDRANAELITREAPLSGMTTDFDAGKIIITGAVTEFGRKETGTAGLGGLVSESKTQTAYGKVALSAIDPRTSRVLHTSVGVGEFAVENGHLLGFGSRAGYDPTLTDKVLDLAVIEAVNDLVASLDRGEWTPGS